MLSPGAEESGEYVCTATNAAGHARRKVQLTVYGEGRRAAFPFVRALFQSQH